jgi:hypothetical protein
VGNGAMMNTLRYWQQCNERSAIMPVAMLRPVLI